MMDTYSAYDTLVLLFIAEEKIPPRRLTLPRLGWVG